MNLTLSIDERLVERARKVARAMGKSLNQLVREYLSELTAGDVAEMPAIESRAGSGAYGGVFRGSVLVPNACCYYGD